MVDWWAFGTLLYEVLVGVPPFYHKELRQTYINIARGVLRFPPWLSDSCKDLISGLLNRDPLQRLGAERDSTEIQKHPWFHGLDWNQVYRRVYESPLALTQEKGQDFDLSETFASTFLDEKLVDSSEEDPELSMAEESMFTWVMSPEKCIEIHDRLATAMVKYPSTPMDLKTIHLIAAYTCPIPISMWSSLMQRFNRLTPHARLSPFKFAKTPGPRRGGGRRTAAGGKVERERGGLAPMITEPIRHEGIQSLAV